MKIQDDSNYTPAARLFLWPRGSDTGPIKEIVESLDLGYSVKPFWYEPGKSEDVKRVLILGDGFEYGTLVDYIRPLKEAQFREAVKWALGLCESRGAHTVQEAWERIFGEGVTIWDNVRMDDWDSEWPNG